MSIELVTGIGGTAHIASADVGAYNAYTIGTEFYCLAGCGVTIQDANTVHISTGELLMQGRHIRVKGTGEDVSLVNGATGYNRIDLILLKYTYTNGIETASFEVLTGTPTTGTPVAPTFTPGSILNGDATAYVRFATVTIKDLTPTSVVTNYSILSSLASLKTALTQSLYPVGSIFQSTLSTNPRTQLGFGTWTQIKDKFLLACGSSYKAGTTGGEATHALTVDEMPSHSHNVNSVGWANWSSASQTGHSTYWGGKNSTTLTCSSKGGNQAHNNMPPYIAVYVWQRTA